MKYEEKCLRLQDESLFWSFFFHRKKQDELIIFRLMTEVNIIVRLLSEIVDKLIESNRIEFSLVEKRQMNEIISFFFFFFFVFCT